MYILFLNDMRCNTEQNSPVARAETIEELARFVESERVEPYKENMGSIFHEGEHTYSKCFRKFGPLEWFNYPSGDSFYYPEVSDVGTLESHIQKVIEKWNRDVLSIPSPIPVDSAAPADNGGVDATLVEAWKKHFSHVKRIK